MQLVNWISSAVFLSFVAGIPCVGAFKKIKVFDVFVEGAQEGFNVVLRIVPFLVGMVVAIGMLRASGAFELLAQGLGPVLNAMGVPPDLLPLMLARPFSGAASNAVLVDIIRAQGGDSMIAHMAATMIGSTETTLYVVAVYFGAVGIRRTRHAIACGLIADAVGMFVSIFICRFLIAG
ncbi:MAG: spore maturation protein [Legionellales bacterium]|nr:spore maturation protein [Legionellales bacterium]